jgi:hypothetical protein
MTASSPNSLLSQAYRAAPDIAMNSGSLFRCLPLDASIKNYDSLYHVLSTNVKTEQTAAPHREDKGSGLSGSEEEVHRTAHALA